ncbi:putative L,D-transpeptidase LppS precursor [Streptomyces chartreusis NRRL 3882]|uniref:Putative L,D-transpeptidase LppS n=3 Tax=Streptomyces TaxID=1883 RepID=A0A2N9BK59_STRCX|nr:L,D-transpeptidase family protein [Streptomyces sp. SID5464]SOR83750.1 putative L,D-transpeptidase LppS precursor [Streptomyces chartreusis NRRL 3882]
MTTMRRAPEKRRPMKEMAYLAAFAVVSVLALVGCGASANSSASPRPGDITIKPVSDASGRAEPDQPIHCAATHAKLTKVAVTRPNGSLVDGTLDTATGTWRPTHPLGLDARYTVTATATGSAGTSVTKRLNIETIDPSGTVTAQSITPATGAQVGDAQPVVVVFTKPVTDEAALQKALSVTDTHHVTGAWHWVTDRRVDYRPRTYWPLGDKITVTGDLDGVNAGKGLWATGDYTHTFTVDSDVHAVVDPGTQSMAVYRGSRLLRKLPISSGGAHYRTWGGYLVVLDKEAKIRMTSCSVGLSCTPGSPDYYDLPVLWDVHLTWTGTYIHDASWDNAAIGRVDNSHGCVHLSASDAKWFYTTVTPGDLVQVINPSKPVALDNGDGDWNLSWARWSTPDATR